MDFVDSRSQYLLSELSIIEDKKKDFKKVNNLTNISSDAQINVNQKLSYNTELFDAESQKDLTELLNDVISKNKFKLIPVNIGVSNAEINKLIAEYNILVNDRDRYILSGAGKITTY